MKTVLKITIVNLIIVILYFVIFRFVISNTKPNNTHIDLRMMNVIILMQIQVFTNLGLSIYWFIKKRNDLGMGFLLSIMVVLLVGFSMCGII